MFSHSKHKQSSKPPKFADIPLEVKSPSTKYDGVKTSKLPVIHQDLLYLIIEHAYYNRLFLPDFTQLSRYSLVARAWRKPAQSLLFHEVTIRDDAAYKSLSLIFDNKHSERAKWLAGCVRVLNYWISTTDKDKVKASTWESRLAPTLNWFPLLYELRLGVDALHKLHGTTMDALNSTPPIRALQIAMRRNENGAQSHASVVPFQVLGITAWKLEFLVMRGDQFNLAAHTGFPPVQHELLEFRFIVDTAATASVEELITYVTANSLKTLEVLHVPVGSHPVVLKVAPTLLSLKVTSQVGIPKRLNRLKELLIVDPLLHPTSDLDVSFYAALPPNITHLGLRSGYGLEKSQVTAIKHILPQKLQVLSLYCDSLTLSSRMEATQTFMAGNEMEIRLWKGKEFAFVGMRSDLVKSTVYPRGVSVENMRYMGRLGSSGSGRAAPQPTALGPALLRGITSAVRGRIL